MSSWAIQALLSPLSETWQSAQPSRLLRAHGVGHVGRERGSREAARRGGLLLRVDPLAVLVLRGDEDRAGRARGGDAVLRHRAVLGQEVDVVAQGLEVVARSSCGSPRPRCGASASSCWPSARDGSRSSSWSRPSGRRSRSCLELAWARALRVRRRRRPRSCRRAASSWPGATSRCSAGCPGVTESTTCGTSHSTPSVTMLRWVILPRRLCEPGLAERRRQRREVGARGGRARTS